MHRDFHDQRKRVVAIFIITAAVPVLVFFGLSHVHRGEYAYGITLFSLVATFGIAVILIARNKAPYRLLAAIILIFFISMLIYGRTKGVFILWILLFPTGAFFMLGKKTGHRLNMLLLAAIIAILLFPDPLFHTPAYDFDFSLRFILVYMILGGLTYTFEATRAYYQQSMEHHQQLLTEEKNKLEICARTDFLTGLINRHYITELIEYERARSRRSRRMLTIVMADIDDFKRINDTHGHDCGDLVLATLARIMRASIRLQDYVARWGGEEFMLLLPETDANGAHIVAEKIRTEIESATIEYNDARLSVTMSFGIAEMNGENERIDDIVKRADQALYRAKQQGKNRVVVDK